MKKEEIIKQFNENLIPFLKETLIETEDYEIWTKNIRAVEGAIELITENETYNNLSFKTMSDKCINIDPIKFRDMNYVMGIQEFGTKGKRDLSNITTDELAREVARRDSIIAIELKKKLKK